MDRLSVQPSWRKKDSMMLLLEAWRQCYSSQQNDELVEIVENLCAHV
jgi:hypothetical protein